MADRGQAGDRGGGADPGQLGDRRPVRPVAGTGPRRVNTAVPLFQPPTLRSRKPRLPPTLISLRWTTTTT